MLNIISLTWSVAISSLIFLIDKILKNLSYCIDFIFSQIILKLTATLPLQCDFLHHQGLYPSLSHHLPYSGLLQWPSLLSLLLLLPSYRPFITQQADDLQNENHLSNDFYSSLK